MANGPKNILCLPVLFLVALVVPLLLSAVSAQVSEPLRVDPPIGANLRNLNGDRVKMGANGACDQGQDPLRLDWDGNPEVYTCSSGQRIPVDKSVRGRIQCANIPTDYVPWHHCYNEKIVYRNRIPHHGSHRPVWPTFGEYSYVPAQRWLHSIEHGAVVMLYDPCADPQEVTKLRNILKSCIRKHVITAWDKMTSKRPLALVAWGCRFEMSFVNEAAVVSFIRNRGLKGPEGTFPKEGQYNVGLLDVAKAPIGSNMNDTTLCPNYPL